MKDNLNFDITYRELPRELFQDVDLPEIENIRMVIFNEALVKSYGMPDREIFENIFNRKFIEENNLNIRPLAQAYGGHQYGHFRNLGDGRAMLLGEFSFSEEAERNLDKRDSLDTVKRIDIHLKGSGQTRFSRGGDGRATLSSVLREYIASEFMNSLGIPTTRSLAVFKTGEKIFRNSIEDGGILFRVADSHIRIGSFQYAAQMGREALRALAEYTIHRHYPSIENDERKYLDLFRIVQDRQARLVAKWQSIGFVHGVMNTDNVLVSGQTIDFGPFAFINEYEEEATFSSIDRYGRYSYGNQLDITCWNLARFGETLLPLENDKPRFLEKINESLEEFKNQFYGYYYEEMASKLGMDNTLEARNIVDKFLNILRETKCDYTNIFIALVKYLEGEEYKHINNVMKFFENKNFEPWETQWKQSLYKRDVSEAIRIMKSKNPVHILRNTLLEEALLKAVKGDMGEFNTLLEEIQKPFDYHKISERHLGAFSNRDYITYCGT